MSDMWIVCIPLLMKFLRIQGNVMAPIIIVICIVGAYATNNSMFDVWVMLTAGVFSYYLQKKDFQWHL